MTAEPASRVMDKKSELVVVPEEVDQEQMLQRELENVLEELTRQGASQDDAPVPLKSSESARHKSVIKSTGSIAPEPRSSVPSAAPPAPPPPAVSSPLLLNRPMTSPNNSSSRLVSPHNLPQIAAEISLLGNSPTVLSSRAMPFCSYGNLLICSLPFLLH